MILFACVILALGKFEVHTHASISTASICGYNVDGHIYKYCRNAISYADNPSPTSSGAQKRKNTENGAETRRETVNLIGGGRECGEAWTGMKMGQEWIVAASSDGQERHLVRMMDAGVVAVLEPIPVVLHHYGCIYHDVDIGRKRPLVPLPTYPVILPKTIAVGVSNDLMFSTKAHPNFSQLIQNLATFDHSWFLNYPMNAKDGEAPYPGFSHFYGSSWHADDAAFIGFLGHWGNKLMLAGVVVLIAGLAFMALPIRQRRQVMRLMGELSSRRVQDSSLGDRTNDRQRGVLFFLPASIRPHDVELNPSIEEMRLEKRRHVQEPDDDGPGEYRGSSSSSHLHDV
ncbi:hypothetical protein F5146DRAFT_995702 [Armillaria mellea]|nr:hypothetical protein F5146DRAFT_995702 [Armillaria mellea]